eukprot:1451220-Rhodomonas_salina.1
MGEEKKAERQGVFAPTDFGCTHIWDGLWELRRTGRQHLLLLGAHTHERTRQVTLFSWGMLDAVGQTDQTRLGIRVQLTREGSWWGKGG